MRPIVKWLVGVGVAVVAIVGAGLSYLVMAYPSVPPADSARVVVTPERLRRGQYLFEHVAL